VKAALQIVRICFGLVPLQRWLNGIGVALIAMSVGIAIIGPGREFMGLIIAGVLGMFLIALAPGFCGGAMLRHGLSRTLLHLRPHGRARMLLGATLAITLMAAVAALPVTITLPQVTRSIARGGSSWTATSHCWYCARLWLHGTSWPSSGLRHSW
jgi:hypothetical protein